MACVRRNRTLNWEPSFETSDVDSVSTVASRYVPSSDGSTYSEEFPAESTPTHYNRNRGGLSFFRKSSREQQGKSYTREENAISEKASCGDNSCVELTDSTLQESGGDNFNCLRCQSYKKKIKEASDYLVKQVLLERRSNHLLKSKRFHHMEDSSDDSRDARKVKKAKRKAKSPNVKHDSGMEKTSKRDVATPTSNSSNDPTRNTAGKEMNSARREITPARKDLTPARKEMTPARKEMTPARKEMTPARRDARKEMTPARKEMTPSRKEMTPARKEMNPARKEMTPARRDARKEMTLARKEVTPSRKEMTPSRKEMTPARKEMVLTRKETVPAKKELTLRSERAGSDVYNSEKSSAYKKHHQSSGKGKGYVPKLSNTSLRITKWAHGTRKRKSDDASSVKGILKRLKLSHNKKTKSKIPPPILRRMDSFSKNRNIEVSTRNRPITRSASKSAALKKRSRPQNTAVKSKHLTQITHKRKQGESVQPASKVQKASNSSSSKQLHPSTVKYNQFTRDVMSVAHGSNWVAKPVEKVPGVGLLNTSVLKKNGISTAKCLYGHYLTKGRQFKKYLESFGIDRLSAKKIHLSLKTWDEYHN